MSRSSAKSVTLRDIAREAEVSVAAVSLALRGHPSVSHDTRRRIKRISERMHYAPTRRRPIAAEAGSVTRIGLVFSGLERSESVAELLNVLGAVGDRRELSVEVVRSIEGTQGGVLGSLAAQASRYAGLLVAGHLRTTEVEYLLRIETPWVVMGMVEGTPPPACRMVMADMVGAARALTGRLLAGGHKAVGFFCGPTVPGLWNHQWLLGYLQAHQLAGCPVEPARVLTNLAVPVHEVGTRAAELFAAMPDRPSAYVTPTIFAATRFLVRSWKLGSRLDAAAVLSGGTLEQARDCHGESLPLARLNHRRLAQVAVAALVEAIEQPDLPVVTRLLPVEFTPGAETGGGVPEWLGSPMALH